MKKILLTLLAFASASSFADNMNVGNTCAKKDEFFFGVGIGSALSFWNVKSFSTTGDNLGTPVYDNTGNCTSNPQIMTPQPNTGVQYGSLPSGSTTTAGLLPMVNAGVDFVVPESPIYVGLTVDLGFLGDKKADLTTSGYRAMGYVVSDPADLTTVNEYTLSGWTPQTLSLSSGSIFWAVGLRFGFLYSPKTSVYAKVTVGQNNASLTLSRLQGYTGGGQPYMAEMYADIDATTGDFGPGQTTFPNLDGGVAPFTATVKKNLTFCGLSFGLESKVTSNVTAGFEIGINMATPTSVDFTKAGLYSTSGVYYITDETTGYLQAEYSAAMSDTLASFKPMYTMPYAVFTLKYTIPLGTR